MMVHHKERFIAFAIFEPVDAEIGYKVRNITGVLFRNSHLNKFGIVVNSLAGQDIPVVKAGRVSSEVPFADYCGFIARLLQEFREGLLGAVKAQVVLDYTV